MSLRASSLLSNFWRNIEGVKDRCGEGEDEAIAVYDDKQDGCSTHCDAESGGRNNDLSVPTCFCGDARRELRRRAQDVLEVRSLARRQGPIFPVFGDTTSSTSVDTSIVESESSLGVSSTTMTVTPFADTASSGLSTVAPSTNTPASVAATPTAPTVDSTNDGVPTSTDADTGSQQTSPSVVDPDFANAETPSTGASSKGGLGHGAQIGLGVGLGLGLAALLAIIAFFLIARRRRRKQMRLGTAKYSAPGQSDLSMIEADRGFPSQQIHGHGGEQWKAAFERSEPATEAGISPQPHYVQEDDWHGEDADATNYSHAARDVFQTPVSAIVPHEPPYDTSRQFLEAPPRLVIPGQEAIGRRSMEASFERGDVSQVSPVSPMSGNSFVGSGPPSPKHGHG